MISIYLYLVENEEHDTFSQHWNNRNPSSSPLIPFIKHRLDQAGMDPEGSTVTNLYLSKMDDEGRKYSMKHIRKENESSFGTFGRVLAMGQTEPGSLGRKGLLKADEIEEAGEKLIKDIQNKYHITKEKAEEKYDTLVRKTDETIETLKKKSSNAIKTTSDAVDYVFNRVKKWF